MIDTRNRCRACDKPGHNTRRCPAPDPAAAAVALERRYREKLARQKRDRKPYSQWSSEKKAKHRTKQKRLRHKTRPRDLYVTPAQLRAEGVIEIGCAVGAILFVLTNVKLHVIHASHLPEVRT